MSGPAMNRVVADFTAEATGDQKIQLKALRGKHVVLYFYPKDSTPGCTQEGLDFKALHAKSTRQAALIRGVSRDSPASPEQYNAQPGFPFDSLSDPDEKLCKKFDVIREKQHYGRTFMGVERSTFLIDKDGKLREEWRKVKVTGHADEVLDRVKMLNAD